MHVVFVGLGGVASVMLRAISELAHRENTTVSFTVFVRNEKQARAAVPFLADILSNARFIEISDFKNILDEYDRFAEALQSANVVVNTAAPSLNTTLLELANRIDAHYADLASDMYSETALSKLAFEQDAYDEQFKARGKFALINIGISPGVTNFLIGDHLRDCDATCQFDRKAVRLHLLEEIRSREIVFSWSPQVALDELEQKPRFYEAGSLTTIEPFTNDIEYEFPHFKGAAHLYPIYQEEVLSLHHSFPHIQSVQVRSGGSEIELVKNLFQLNLLSKDKPVCADSGITIDKVVRDAIPGLKAQEELDTMVREGVIMSAQFAAVAEIEKEHVTEVVGLSYHTYTKISGTPYRGATYVAYPTGIGAAVLLFHSLTDWETNDKQLRGVVRAEELPRMFGPAKTEKVIDDLARFDIDIILHTHGTRT